jgi:anti-anti-sigma regulatory factor
MGVATINVNVSDDGVQARVTVSGSVTIENSVDFRQALMAAFDQAAWVALDIRRLDEADITAAQVICSACKTAAALERCLVAEGETPECLIDFGKSIGAPRGLACSQNNNESCNWFGGAR